GKRRNGKGKGGKSGGGGSRGGGGGGGTWGPVPQPALWAHPSIPLQLDTSGHTMSATMPPLHLPCPLHSMQCTLAGAYDLGDRPVFVQPVAAALDFDAASDSAANTTTVVTAATLLAATRGFVLLF
ncbi:unnamed protein product, partial [Closterium sp. NIES-53]